jgi:hypothetical protein
MRARPSSVKSLEELGRVRLSASFFMRDFLHSEIADFHGIPNIPDAPDMAIAAGRNLCEQLLEPLQATFGRLAIRSAYRAPAVNEFGNRHGLGPTLPIYEAYNPAIAEVNAEHVFSIAEFDVMNNGIAPEQAIDNAFKRAEAIFAKYASFEKRMGAPQILARSRSLTEW